MKAKRKLFETPKPADLDDDVAPWLETLEVAEPPTRQRGSRGVAKVLHADGASLAENVAVQVLAIAGGYSHVLFPATAHGKNVAPRVAAKLEEQHLSIEPLGALRATRLGATNLIDNIEC